MVGEQLQRNGVDGGSLEVGDVARHGDHGHPIVFLESGLGIREHDQFAATGAYFHQVRLELVEQVVVGRHRNHRHVGIDQRERAVLELACGIGLGVDVGNLLELERPFHRDRV